MKEEILEENKEKEHEFNHLSSAWFFFLRKIYGNLSYKEDRRIIGDRKEKGESKREREREREREKE